MPDKNVYKIRRKIDSRNVKPRLLYGLKCRQITLLVRV
jgi:hypothetical protein